MHEWQKSNGLIWKWSTHTRVRHHLPVLNQYKGGGPQVRGKRGCGLVVGRRGSLFRGSLSNSFRGNVMLGWYPTQKRQTWAGITRCMLEGLVREKPNPYPDGSAKGSKEQNKSTFVWKWGIALPTQCISGGWVANRPLGNPWRSVYEMVKKRKSHVLFLDEILFYEKHMIGWKFKHNVWW